MFHGANSSLNPASRRAGRRVAFVTESFVMGGVERWLAMLMTHLDRAQYDRVLVCADIPDIDLLVEDARASGAAVVRTRLLSPPLSQGSPIVISRLARLFRALRIDIVHAQVLGGVGARSIAIAARLAGVRAVVVTIHGVQHMPLDRWRRALHRLIDRVFVTAYTTSSEDNRWMQIRMAGRAPEQIHAISHAIECAPFDPAEDQADARRVLRLPPGGPVIGLIGRLETQKGVEDFLRMARRLSVSAPQSHYVIIGEGKERPRYEALAARLGLAERVRFTGYRTDIARCLAAMDVFVLSSLFEPFGLVLAEAMAMEKPVVATNVGGVPEVIADGRTGFLTPASDPTAAAAAVLRYLHDPDLARRHGQAGRKRVLDNFSAPRMADDMERLYDRCLTESSVRRVRPNARLVSKKTVN